MTYKKKTTLKFNYRSHNSISKPKSTVNLIIKIYKQILILILKPAIKTERKGKPKVNG